MTDRSQPGHATSCRPGCTGLHGPVAVPPLYDVWFPCECACHEGGDDD